MNLEIQEYVTNCENILRDNLNAKRQKEEEFNCLNEFCSEFLSCCNIIQKYLQSENVGSTQFNETIFLCLNQILCCIRYLKKVLKVEKNIHSTLIANRNHFLDRIFWCLSKLKKMFSSSICLIEEEFNFVELMDSVLATVAPYSLTELRSRNKFGYNDQILDCEKIGKDINMILSQILSFANVSLPGDQKALKALCQKVLREGINFQEASKSSSNQNSLQLAASLLENAFYQLEDYLNESLLRLVFIVLIDYSKNYLDELRILIKIDSDDERVNYKIADFDMNVDRILQIGLFTIAFASNSEMKSKVRSCLASLESLDELLIPSLYCNTDTILEEHYLEEMNKFKLAIHEIVDTSAFLMSYIEQLSNFIIEMEKDFDKKKLCNILEMGKLLKEHFRCNENNLKLKTNNKKNYIEFNLMLNECQAALTYSGNIDVSRVTKRLKIFRSCCKKLKENLISNTINNNYKNKEADILGNIDIWESEENFATFGIFPTITTIMYENKRNRKSVSLSMIGNNSKINTLSPSNELNSKEKGMVKRNTSLRTAIFKKQKKIETERLCEMLSENSNSLQITEILDELSNISSKLCQ